MMDRIRKRMRIIHVSAYPARSVSGINQTVRNLAGSLRPQGYQVELWCPGDEVANAQPLEIVSLAVARSRGRNLALAFRTFRRLLKDGRDADVIHVHQPHFQSLIALIAARLLGRPSVVTFHVKVPDARPLMRFRDWLLARLEARCADATVVLSPRVADDFSLRAYRIIPNGVTVPPVVDELLSAPDAARSDGLTLVFVGRVTRTKGVFVLLEALASLQARLPGLRLTTFGPVDEPIEYEGAKQKLGVDSVVSDEGFDPAWRERLRPDVLFVLPSFYEGMPLALLEAMASGMLVVATPVGSIPDIVRDKETGLLAAVGDPDALAKAIQWAAEHPSAARNIAANGRQLVSKHYSIEAVARSHLELYRGLASVR